MLGPDKKIYIFCVVGMGGASGPLIWGRVAAWVSRHTQAMFDDALLRLQTFVDDPKLTARGRKRERRRRFCIAVLLWMALGLRLSWKKLQIGYKVQWIGIQIEVTLADVILTIPEGYIAKMLTECSALRQLQPIPMKRMRRFVGGMAWLMQIVIWVRAWLAPLWSAVAVSASWAGPADKATIGQKQVAHSLCWIEAFLSGQRGSLIRTIPISLQLVEQVAQIVCDASPWGVGATLLLGGSPIEWLGDDLTAEDHSILGTNPGDPAGQASFEALAILVACRTWLPLWHDLPLTVVLQSDSIAALGSAAKLGSSVPALNTVIRELALEMAEGCFEVDLFGHIPGHLNVWADALSRLRDPNGQKTVPEELLQIKRATVAPRPSGWWRAQGAPGGTATSTSSCTSSA